MAASFLFAVCGAAGVAVNSLMVGSVPGWLSARSPIKDVNFATMSAAWVGDLQVAR